MIDLSKYIIKFLSLTYFVNKLTHNMAVKRHKKAEFILSFKVDILWLYD